MPKKKKRGVAKAAKSIAKKTKLEKLPLFKKILGDEFLAVSAIILFVAFLKLGYGTFSIAVTLLIIATFSFIAGVSIKGHIKKNY